jgi:hypothetical protein
VRPRSKRRFIAPAVVGLLLVAAVLVYIGSRNSTGTKKPSAGPSASEKAFSLREISFVPVYEGKTPAAAAVRAERSTIHTMMTDYYFRTFVNPTAWKHDPTFAAQATRFTPEARAAFAHDVAAMTIGDGRADIATVKPSVASIKISIYFDGHGIATFAVAVVNFRAAGTTTTGKLLTIVQRATYRMQKTGKSWLIFSYSANGSQNSPSSPSPSPSGSASS